MAGIIAQIDIAGEIDESSALNFQMQCRALPTTARAARALIVRLSSQGGSLGAAQAVDEALRFVRLELNIPVIGVVTDVALSAAFYVAQSVDTLVVCPSAVLGSVGAIRRRIDVSPLLRKFDIKYEAITSSKLKDGLGLFAPSTSEEMDMILSLCVDQGHQFIKHIEARRPDVRQDTIDHIRSGRIFTGEAALNEGLADRAGSLLTALKIAGENTGLTTPKLKILRNENGPRSVVKLIKTAVVQLIIGK